MNQPMAQPLTGLQKIEAKLDVQRVGGTAVSAAAGGLAFQNLSEVLEVAKLMALSDVAVPKHLRSNPGACLAITIQAVEWNFSPFAVANKSFSVNDRLGYEAQLVHAVILSRAPIKGRPKHEYSGEGDKRRLRVWAETTDGETVDYTSPELGRITPKNSPLWKNDPDQQLHYSSVRAWCRRHFPDVLLGTYTKDELEDGGLKDITPPAGSGLAERLQGGNGGFNADNVDAAISEAVEGDALPEAVVDHSDPETPAGDLAYDEDAVRAGGQACVDGEAREAPEDFTPEQAAGWLHGYDQTAAAIGGR